MDLQTTTTRTEVTSADSHVTEVEVDDRPIKSDIINGWFNEWIEVSCGGHAMCLKVDEVVFHQRSEYQDVLIFKRLYIVSSLQQVY